jgi:DNA-binding transcriptional MerR regulator
MPDFACTRLAGGPFVPDVAPLQFTGGLLVPDFAPIRFTGVHSVPGFDSDPQDVGHVTPDFRPGQWDVGQLAPDFQRISCDVEHHALSFRVAESKARHPTTTFAEETLKRGHLVLDFARDVPDIRFAMRGIPPGTHPDLDTYDPDREYSLRDLAAVTNVGRHAIGHYVKRGLLPRTESRGPHTRYTEEHRIRLLAIAQLRGRGYGLAQMAKALDGASLDDIFRVAGYQPPAEEPAVAPAVVAAPVAPAAVAEKAPELPPLPAEEPLGAYRWHSARKRRHWESVAICPGVFLVVLADADTEARRVAREIESRYGGAGEGAKRPPA